MLMFSHHIWTIINYSNEWPIHFACDKICNVISVKLATCYVASALKMVASDICL